MNVGCDVEATDPPAFASLFAEYAPRVRALGCRRAGPDLADDVVQETFLRAYRAYDRYVDEGKSWAWIRRIAEHVCIDLHRRAAVEDAAMTDGRLSHHAADCDETDADETFGWVMARHQRGAVATVLAGLNPRHRRVLVLRELGGWSHRDIADEHGMTIDGVKATLKRARSAFRSAYEAHAGQSAGFGAVVGLLGTVRRQLRRLASAAEPAAGVPAVVAGVIAAVALSIAVGGGLPDASSAGPDGSTAGDGAMRPLSDVHSSVTIAAWRPLHAPGAPSMATPDAAAPGVPASAVAPALRLPMRDAGDDADAVVAPGTAAGAPGDDGGDDDEPGLVDGILPPIGPPPDVYDDDQTCRPVPSPGRQGGTYLCLINVIDVQGLRNTMNSTPEGPVETSPSSVAHDAEDTIAGDTGSDPAPTEEDGAEPLPVDAPEVSLLEEPPAVV